MTLSELAPVVAAQQGVLYTLDNSEEKPQLRLLASYGHTAHDAVKPTLALGEGLIGQCAIEKRQILLSNVPAGLHSHFLRPRRWHAGDPCRLTGLFEAP